VRDMRGQEGGRLGQCGSHYAAGSGAGFCFLSFRSGGSASSVS
jgi:hypothetical protein